VKVELDGERAFIAAIGERVRTFAATRDCEAPAVRVTLSRTSCWRPWSPSPAAA